MYSGAFPTPGTEATVIEDPAGACSDAAEELDPGIWQPASSTAVAAAQPAAIRARLPLQGRAGQRRAGTTFIAPQARQQILAVQDSLLRPSVPSLAAAADQTSQIAHNLPLTPVYWCGVAKS
jgi:hypothetical protein